MRVLILAHDFPPLNTIGSRRPYSWFRYLPQWGIHPIVITKSWENSSATAYEIAAQKGISKTEIDETPERTIIKVPLKKTLPEKLLAKYGASGFSLLRKAFSFVYRMLSFLFSGFDKNEGIYHAACEYLKEHAVDYIIATGEPFILFKYGHQLSKKFHIPWIADFRDGWYLNHITAQQKSLATAFLWQWEFFFEKHYLSSCRFITSVDPLLSSRLGELHNKKAFVIYNGFEEFLPEEPHLTSLDLPLVLCYGGTLYTGHQAEILFQALEDLDREGKISSGDLKLQFLGIEFYPEQYRRVKQFSSSISKYLETTKRLPREEASKVIRAADFLIVFTDRWTPVLPSKIYEYIASRRPAVVILNDHSILTNLVTELKAGIVLDSIEELKKFLLEKIEAKKNQRPLFIDQLDEAKAMKYSRESQAHELALLLQKNL